MNKIFFSVKNKSVFATVVILVFVFLFLYIITEETVYQYLKQQKESTLNKDKAAFNTQLLSYYRKEESSSLLMKVKKNAKVYSIKNNSRCFLVSNTGKVVFDSFDDYSSEDFSFVSEVQDSLVGVSKFNIYRLDDGKKVVYSSTPIVVDSKVKAVFLIVDSFDREETFLNLFRSLFVYYAVFVIVLICLLVYSFLGRVFVPLGKMVKFSNRKDKHIDRNEISPTLDIEYEELLSTVNSLLAAKQEIESVNKDFISNVSHELKTPIAAMKIMSDTLVTSPCDDIEVYRDFMNDINGELDHMTAIIVNMIGLLYLEKGEYTLNLELVNVVSIVEHRVNNLKGQAGKKDIELNFHSKESCFIKIDRNKIIQVFDNLINNAIKFTREGGSIDVDAVVTRDFVEFSVADTGMGINEQDLNKIFDRFYMADESRTRVFESSGIGLAIVKEVVTLHSGKIRVESEVGVGTTFYIKLPRTKV